MWSCTARRCVHCVRVNIQLPAHQYIDDRTQEISSLNLYFSAISFLHSICRSAKNRLHEASSLSAISFVKCPSNVIHNPSALKPSSRCLRIIVVPDTTMLPGRMSCAGVHHTASLESMFKPACFSNSHSSLAIVCSSATDIPNIQQLSAKSSSPKYPPHRIGRPISSFGTFP